MTARSREERFGGAGQASPMLGIQVKHMRAEVSFPGGFRGNRHIFKGRVHALSESPDPRTPAHARAGDPWCQLDAAADAAGRWPVRGPWIGRLDGLGRIWLSISCWWSTAWAATAARAAAGESRGGFAGSTLQVGSGWHLR